MCIGVQASSVGRNFAADSAKRRHPGNETPWKVEPFPRYAKKFTGRSGRRVREGEEVALAESLLSCSLSLVLSCSLFLSSTKGCRANWNDVQPSGIRDEERK